MKRFKTIHRSTPVCRQKGAARYVVPFLAVLLCMLAGCGDKDGDNKAGITAYTLGEESIPALQLEEKVEIATTDPDTYGYIGLSDSGSTVEKYVTSMTAEENGFLVVDKRNKVVEAPDFKEKTGTVSLARAAAKEDGKQVVVEIDWAVGTCTVQLSMQEAAVTASEPQKLTHIDAETQIRSMKPSVFGLSGDSMEEYHVYIRNGLITVNDEACIWVEIYTSDTAAGTNANAGTFYLSRDGQRLYQLNRDDNSVQAIKMN